MNETGAKPKARMPEQDMTKGILMVAVLFVHCVSLYTVGGREIGASLASCIIYGLMGFAMPAFFVMSGLNYRDKGLSLGQNILTKVKQIILPLLKYTVIIWIVMGTYLIIRGEMTIGQAINSFLGFWITDPLAARLGFDASKTLIAQTVGPTWFLKALFTGSIVFLIVAPKVYNNIKRCVLVSIGLMLISTTFYALRIKLPWFIDAAPHIAAIMLTGCIMKTSNVLDNHKASTLQLAITVVLFFAFSIFLQMHFFKVATITAGAFTAGFGIVEIFLTPVYGFLGAYSMMLLCRIIIHKGMGVVSHFLEWFGQRTFVSLVFHGPIMRIFADIFGVTGSAPTFTWRNALVFVCSLIGDVLLLMIIDWMQKKRGKTLVLS